MRVPEKFPSGCEFFTTVRNIRNFVKYPNKKIYLLAWNGVELEEVRDLPDSPIAPLSENSFLTAAIRCRTFHETRYGHESGMMLTA